MVDGDKCISCGKCVNVCSGMILELQNGMIR
ncbi:MAG: 4Fe-4S binding protein [Macellibacteroides sp.]